MWRLAKNIYKIRRDRDREIRTSKVIWGNSTEGRKKWNFKNHARQMSLVAHCQLSIIFLFHSFSLINSDETLKQSIYVSARYLRKKIHDDCDAVCVFYVIFICYKNKQQWNFFRSVWLCLFDSKHLLHLLEGCLLCVGFFMRYFFQGMEI